MLPVGSQEHNHVWRVLNNMARLGGGLATNGQANNGHKTELVDTATPTPSIAPLSTLTRGRCAIASLSTSVARGHGRPAIASPSISGRRATTPRVVTSPEMPAPILHAFP